MNNTIIRSISDNQVEIIQNILKLHVPSQKIDCDMTYGKGMFYKTGEISEPKYCFDMKPQTQNVIYADCRQLPLADASVSCVMFDPPFLATKGKSLQTDTGNIINKRFGVYPDEISLHQFYADSLKEAFRILQNNGILIFKCQDKVGSGKQYMSHLFIANTAIQAGFYPKDLFILLAKNRLIANWQRTQQKHARKYHCYFWVFQKNGYTVRYI